MHEQWFGPRSGALVDVSLHIMPHAPAERVLDIALLGTAVVEMDDLFEEADPHTGLAAYVAAFRAGRAPADGNPNLMVLGRVLERARRAFGPRLYPRFVTACEQWADRMTPGVAAASSWDDLDSYLRFRRPDFGFDAMRVMAEYGAGVDLTDLESSPLLDGLHTACYEHALFVNDLFSYRKENQAGDGRNAVSVLIATEGMTMQAAVDTVCGRITDAEQAFTAQVDPGARTDIAISVVDIVLQNPLISSGADSPFVPYLPTYGAVQEATAGAFSTSAPLRAIGFQLLWFTAAAVIALLAFHQRTRNALPLTAAAAKPNNGCSGGGPRSGRP